MLPSRRMRASMAKQSGPQPGQHAIGAVVSSPVAAKRFAGTSASHGGGPSLPSARLTSAPSIRTITAGLGSPGRACKACSTDSDSDDGTGTW